MPRNTIDEAERAFAKADAEHTSLTERLQDSANKRETARKRLEEAREGGSTDVVEVGPEQVEGASE